MPGSIHTSASRIKGKVRPGYRRTKQGTFAATGTCAAGHRRTDRNTYTNPTTGKRYCRTCHNTWRQEQRAEARLQRHLAAQGGAA